MTACPESDQNPVHHPDPDVGATHRPGRHTATPAPRPAPRAAFRAPAPRERRAHRIPSARLRLATGAVAVLGMAIPLLPSGPTRRPERPIATQPAAAGSPACSEVADHYGHLFPGLDRARWDRADIDALATRTMAEEEDEPTPEDEVDDEDNLDIDAGYTYAGQFIDHDLTKETILTLAGELDPADVTNARTPAFDLDSVYGAGPAGSPQLYAADRLHLLQGDRLTGAGDDSGAVDHPRDARGQALLGDPRDDDNRLVASLHSIVVRFHNLQVDLIRSRRPGLGDAQVFRTAKQRTRWDYQYAILTDFLPAVVGRSMVRRVLPSLDVTRQAPDVRFYDPCSMAMPIEFSAAAYRYGHSQVRALYRINGTMPDRLPVFTEDMDPTHSLVGFMPAPAGTAVDWQFFFAMNGAVRTGHPQDSYKIDTSLVHALSLLPLPAIDSEGPVLASRNLLRGEQLGLPSGQDVAERMGVTPLRDDQILIGKATGDPADATPITEISADFAGSTPLWTYVLAEAMNRAYRISGGQIRGEQRAAYRLGPVGGRIVTETFVGLMAADRDSVLYQRGFSPERAFTTKGRFGFRELIAAATGHNVALDRPTRVRSNATTAVGAASATPTDATRSTTDAATGSATDAGTGSATDAPTGSATDAPTGRDGRRTTGTTESTGSSSTSRPTDSRTSAPPRPTRSRTGPSTSSPITAPGNSGDETSTSITPAGPAPTSPAPVDDDAG